MTFDHCLKNLKVLYYNILLGSNKLNFSKFYFSIEKKKFNEHKTEFGNVLLSMECPNNLYLKNLHLGCPGEVMPYQPFFLNMQFYCVFKNFQYLLLQSHQYAPYQGTAPSSSSLLQWSLGKVRKKKKISQPQLQRKFFFKYYLKLLENT